MPVAVEWRHVDARERAQHGSSQPSAVHLPGMTKLSVIALTVSHEHAASSDRCAPTRPPEKLVTVGGPHFYGPVER